jgi:membrane protein
VTEATDDRGRDAKRVRDMPAKGWRDIAWRVWTESGRDNVSLIAAGVAFYGFLAFVPLLAAFVLTYGLIADPATVMSHIQSLFELLPADAARLIADQLINVATTSAGKTGLGLLLALALALYGAMRGATAMITALNIVYEEEETRSFFKTTLLALAITVAMVVVGVVGVLAIAALAALEALVPWMPKPLVTLIRIGFWVAAAAAASGAIAAIFRYGPDRARAQWRWLTPGAIIATLGWLAASLGFGFYAANFGDYNATYGALGAVVVLLMWLYLSAYILLLGAELNSELEHQTAVDTTEGHAKPMGSRGAVMADTIGKVP